MKTNRMKFHAVALAVTTGLALLAGCQGYPAPLAAPAGVAARAPEGAGQVLLTGRAQFPGYRIAATADEVAAQAVVSLIDAQGVTRAAGVTDATGAFTLYQSTTPFTPAEGQGFGLEVMKRVPTATGTAWVALRTKVKRVGDAWSSITGPAVVVNLTTTAVARLDDRDAAVSLDAILGTVAGATVTAFGGYDQAQVDALVATLEGRLLAGEDPAGPLVHKGDLTLETDSDVAAFASYDVIEGSLDIAGALGSVSLPHLKQVTGSINVVASNLVSLDCPALVTIGGQLCLNGARSLTSMAGFPALEHITDELYLQDCASLESLDGLENLRSVKTLYLNRNPKLASLAALSGLTSLTGDLMINRHPLLTNLAGLEGLTRIEGEVRLGVNVDGSWSGSDPSGLTSLKGLDNVTSIGGLKLSDNPLLATLDGGETPGVGGLSNLTTLNGGDFDLYENARLTSLAPLGQLTGAVGHLGFWNTHLTSLAGLEGITSVVELNFQHNYALTSLDAMANYAGGRFLFVQNNPLLVVECDQPFPKVSNAAFATFFAVTIQNNGGDAGTCYDAFHPQ